MPRIVIYAKTRLSDEAVSKLVAELEANVSDADIEVRDAERRGYGVTWWEVVLIFILSEASKKVIGEVTEAGIQWAKKRLSDEGNSRPKLISLFGAEGVPLASKSINASGEVQDASPAPDGEHVLKLIEQGQSNPEEK